MATSTPAPLPVPGPRPTPADIRFVADGRGSPFFTRKNMQFAGDTMRNYGVRGPKTMRTHSGDVVRVWELYRRRPVKNGLQNSAYFDAYGVQRFGTVSET